MREYAFCGDLLDAQVMDFDVVIAGSGVAGLYSALNLESGLSCAVLNKLGVGESISYMLKEGLLLFR